jgi:ATP-binding cassette subfamily B protein
MDLAGYLERLPSHSAGDEPQAQAEAVSNPSFAGQLRALALHWRIVALLGAQAAETGLVIAGWAFIGSGALSGRLDSGWMAAWALCLVSAVPLHAASQWLAGIITIAIGGTLRQRLLAGAMVIDPDVIARKGTGELLSEVLEVEQIELLAANGGIASLLAALQLVAALIVFGAGAGGSVQRALLAAWLAVALILLAHNTRKRSAWTAQRFEITRSFLENIGAHRTRGVQQPRSERHVQEDRDHEHYAERSRALDRSTAFISAVLMRGYIISALVVLAPSLLGHAAITEQAIAEQAIALGGILLAAAALQRFASGFVNAASAWIAVRRMQPLFEAGGTPAPESDVGAARLAAGKSLVARDLVFTHQGRVEPVLRGCTLILRHGDLVLLEGDSGGGKSTLAAVLAGVRKAQAGTVVWGGLDQQALGRAWCRYVALAPQYHENHLLSAPLSLNLLLGRPLPHSPEDFAAAATICEELGLGSLLARMPSGLHQMIGETGWQLSQGERARVFLARALLQDAEVIVLDESLAALDPENLALCMECIMRRAKTALVIAHP